MDRTNRFTFPSGHDIFLLVLEKRGRGGTADTLSSGGSERKLVEVQILSTAPYIQTQEALIAKASFLFYSADVSFSSRTSYLFT